jgi:hypothetical protein
MHTTAAIARRSEGVNLIEEHHSGTKLSARVKYTCKPLLCLAIPAHRASNTGVGHAGVLAMLQWAHGGEVRSAAGRLHTIWRRLTPVGAIQTAAPACAQGCVQLMSFRTLEGQ